MDGLGGRLLVANPRLADPNFDRTVVLVLAHGDEGALGVVLNRPSEAPVAVALPGWEEVAAPPALVFVGGPVERSTVICLARAATPASSEGAGWAPVSGDVGTLDLDLGPEEAARKVAGVRVFAGYAGWGAGQLEAEIGAGGWFVLDLLAADVLTGQPESLWQQVLRRQGSGLALVAGYPTDPSMN